MLCSEDGGKEKRSSPVEKHSFELNLAEVSQPRKTFCEYLLYWVIMGFVVAIVVLSISMLPPFTYPPTSHFWRWKQQEWLILGVSPTSLPHSLYSHFPPVESSGSLPVRFIVILPRASCYTIMPSFRLPTVRLSGCFQLHAFGPI